MTTRRTRSRQISMIGLILFGHGARDPRWREPFDRLHTLVAQRHDGPVETAFLELMQPTLSDAAMRLTAAGAQRIVVVPLFLGTGGHLRKDLPNLIEAARSACGMPLDAVDAAGENAEVLQAIADYCIASAH